LYPLLGKMAKMKFILKYFQKKNKPAQTTIEYLLLLTLVAVIVIISFRTLLPRVRGSSLSFFDRAAASIMGQTPAVPAVDGHWCPWTPCSKPCDDGTGPGTQTRVCECPRPAGGGAPCFGPSSQNCNTQVCCTPTKTGCNTGECGLFSDGCGGTINCGVCPCVPTKTTCNLGDCGILPNGCPGGTIDCGPCCVPTKTRCETGDCGILPNGCPGGTIDCGPCCVPKTCGPLDCGILSDGCGGTIDCGICGGGPASPGGGPASPA